MSKKKKIIYTVLLGIMVGVIIFGIVLCISNIIDNLKEYHYMYTLRNYPIGFFWVNILRKNIILLSITLFILVVNLAFIVFNIIRLIKTKCLLWNISKVPKEDIKNIKNKRRIEKLESKISKIKNEEDD